MKTSTERILTTHTGSLPRPGSLPTTDPEVLRQAVTETVRRQVDAGVDVVNDGEVSKPSYATYVTSRLAGFGPLEGEGPFAMTDITDFPHFAERMLGNSDAVMGDLQGCVGPVSYGDTSQVRRDIANLLAAVEGSGATEAFMSAASPGVIATFQPNRHYPSDDDYVAALADAMKTEYDLIHDSGLLLQLDCPDLAMGYHITAQQLSEKDFLRQAGRHVEAINHATRDIPPDRMRLHLCWGNYEGPHHRDIALETIIGEVLKARPMAISFEGANPRHEHEWEIWERVRLPDDRVLIPGVVDSTTNYVEHPEVVAQRLERYARLVGQERVLAGSDCGFATFASFLTVDPDITWAKLAAMSEGARLATARLAHAPSAS